MPCCCTRERSTLQILAALASFALFTSIISLTSCRFFEMHFVEEGNKQSGGLFRLQYRHEVCVNYKDIPEPISLNASTEVARAFGVMASIFGAFGLFIVFGMQCLMPPRGLWRTLALVYLCAFFCQSLTFLVYKQVLDGACSQDGVDCSMGIGSIYSILATCLYLLMGLALLLLLPPPVATAYNCPRLSKGIRQVVTWTGITKKRSLQQNLQSLGLKQYALLLVSLTALAFSFAVLFDCRFFEVNTQGSTWKSGLFGYLYTATDSCRLYEYGSRSSFDTSTKAAQAFAVLAVVFGGILCILLWSMLLVFDFPKFTYKILWLLAFWGGVSQALTFLLMKEANDKICGVASQSCSLAVDGILAAIATPLYLLMVPVACSGKVVKRSEEDEDGEDEMDGDLVKDNEHAAADEEAVVDSETPSYDDGEKEA